MSQISDEDRQALRDGFARYLEADAHEEKLRSGIATDRGYDDAIWNQMAEMGLLGIAIPEDFGGIGGGAIDVALVMEEVGKKLVPVPFVSTCVVAAEMIARFAPDSVKQDLLEKIATGEIVVSTGGSGDFVALADDGHSLTAKSAGDGWAVSGEVSFVSHGGHADYHLLGLNEDGAQSAFLVKSSDTVAAKRLTTNDPAQRLFKLKLTDAEAINLKGINADGINQVAMRGIAAAAAEQAGATRAIFEITMEYLRTRYQFGRAIGSFQAMKHMAADLLVEVESATSAALAAAKALDAGAPNAAKFVSLTAFTCKDAFREASAQAIQMHGGIAYTEEHVAHLYWRRARAGLPVFGSSDEHREQYLKSREAA
ncbi:hypothetical protein A8B75_06680 [Sphingomonadales bacterium EhC05]|nr:hypothetical protein A8B75_06680 [Sphingomonadales bacterium EhC05]